MNVFNLIHRLQFSIHWTAKSYISSNSSFWMM